MSQVNQPHIDAVPDHKEKFTLVDTLANQLADLILMFYDYYNN